ncbi:MAG: Crp/Fnr family transcriptional regulator [Roseomonas sp.]|nr:Crp/Fnr family transcriptional regulator [Roseomonas sp.]
MAGSQVLRSRAVPETCNRLLMALPRDDRARIWPRLERTTLSARQAVQVPGQPITDAYFPETSWISMVAVLPDGHTAEVGHCGRDGMTGLPLIFGMRASSIAATVHRPGTALRLGAEALGEELERTPALRALLLLYAMAFNEEVAQLAACIGRHVLEQRLACWLLAAHDQADGDDLPVTHDMLAMMLCVRRSGVTLAARQMQQAGHIRYTKGRITVTGRAGLEELACACYGNSSRRWRECLPGIRTFKRPPAILPEPVLPEAVMPEPVMPG